MLGHCDSACRKPRTEEGKTRDAFLTNSDLQAQHKQGTKTKQQDISRAEQSLPANLELPWLNGVDRQGVAPIWTNLLAPKSGESEELGPGQVLEKMG